MQCEVLQSRLLGGAPADEDPMPDIPIPPGAPFDFFGLGQQGDGLAQNPEEEEDEPQEHAAEPKHPPEDNAAWGLWPVPPQQQQAQGQNMGPQLNLNIEPQQEEVMQMDLNQTAEQNGEDL